jgi:hypothetical protein
MGIALKVYSFNICRITSELLVSAHLNPDTLLPAAYLQFEKMKKKNFIASFFTSFFILTCGAVEAQKELPVGERYVYYLHQQFGLPGTDELKVLVISSHIYRYKYNDGSHGRVETALSYAFRKKMSKIRENEYNSSVTPSSNQVHENHSQEMEFGYYGANGPSATGPEIYETFSSTTELLKRKREKLISDFQKDGYTIFQVTFDEYADDHLKEMKLEKVEKLSILWIPEYTPGVILSMASRYQESRSSNSSGITIEERSDKNKSKSATTAKKADNTDWAAVAQAKSWEAGLLEAEGDRLLKLGELSKAAQQYRAAQATLYTDRVQKKLNNAESSLQGGAALIGGGLDAVQDVSLALDDMKIPKFSAWGLTYNGLSPNNKNKGIPADQVPSATSLTYGGYRIFAMEIGFTYLRSPVYEVFLKDKYGDKTNHTIMVNRSSIGPTASLGLAIPFKHFVIYGMYGYGVQYFGTQANVFTEGYTYTDIMKDMNRIIFVPKTDVGIKIKIPGTNVGFGAHYVMNKYSGKKILLEGDGYSKVTHKNVDYYAVGSVHDSYKYEVIGFSLYYLMKK